MRGSRSVSALVAALACVGFVSGAAQLRSDRQEPLSGGSRLLGFKQVVPDLEDGLRPVTQEFNWMPSQEPGRNEHAFIRENGDLVAEDVVTKQQTVLVESAQRPQQSRSFMFNADRTLAMWTANVTKGYRYSFTANYFIQDMATNETWPLITNQNADIQLATWNPKDPANLMFVWGNNIYFWNSGSITPVTTDGGPNLFHGVPDWVYEEEVIETRSTSWFSPDGEYLAYLSFDDTDVRVYTVPYYMNNRQFAPPYPKWEDIKYPKPGFINPTVKASIVKVESPAEKIAVPLDNAYPKDDIVVGEVAWLTHASARVVFRCFNRVQNADKHLLYDMASGTSTIIRQRAEAKGWLENSKSIKYAGWSTEEKEYYIDLSDEDGWMHIYLYETTGGSPRQLTKGNWEVRAITRVDLATGNIYYVSTEQHPTMSTVSMINIYTGVKTDITPKGAGLWTNTFTPDGNHYILNYEGPNMPYQELYAINQTTKPIRTIEDNAKVMANLRAYAVPKVEYYDLPHPSGFNLSAKLTYPATFDPSKKYPVLLNPYGGPNSQEVVRAFALGGASSFITSNPSLEYATFVVDNRGTGFRGRAFRNEFFHAMGTVEPQDQIWAARWLADRFAWVDRERVGIWGWSNGGYLAAKTVEQDSDIISFAVITAPTNDMRLYDSIYTERYLGNPAVDPAPYDRAALRDATGFKNIVGGVLIQHGTGDDNVHVAHSLSLVDMLIGAGVPPSKVQSQFFPDSDHNINYHGAGAFLYAQLADFLYKQKIRPPKTQQRFAWEEGLADMDGFRFEAMERANVLAEGRMQRKLSPGLKH